MSNSNKSVLIILDGFGIGKDTPFNAINNSSMPFYRELLKKYPHSQLITHGEEVGLPYGVMGNSEVGHMTMGAGRIIYQDLTRISKEVREKKFHNNPVIRQTIEAGAKKTGRVHLMGLLSDGGVHSHIDHLLALLDLCVELQVPNVSVHCFLDGRDTPPDSAAKYLKQLLTHPTLSEKGAGATKAQIVTVGGRYYAMDRDTRWERVQKGYLAMTGQIAPFQADAKSDVHPALQAVEKSHADGKTDEFVEPTLLVQSGAMQSGDSIVFFNYRADRAREITETFIGSNDGSDFAHFDRGKGTDGKAMAPSAYCGLTQYDRKFNKNFAFAYGPQNQNNIFGQWLEERKLSQFRVAETEKYAHVTFFFNGGREKPFDYEERILVPSPKDVPTYDLKPEMSAFEVARNAAEQITSGKYSFVLMNFANADMVGHTGNYAAAVKAMDVLDKCLAQVVGAAEKNGYNVLITADHGNAEEMCDDHGKMHTQHTLNPVPAIWVAPNSSIAPKSARIALRDGTLADIMPTLCDMMLLPIPGECTGKSLLPQK
jgi:2,3-bisphosphoglycerate-independent phosphoglycerate mutase